MRNIEKRMLKDVEEIFEIIDNAKSNIEIIIQPELIKEHEPKSIEFQAFYNAMDLLRSSRSKIEALELTLKNYHEQKDDYEESEENDND